MYTVERAMCLHAQRKHTRLLFQRPVHVPCRLLFCCLLQQEGGMLSVTHLRLCILGQLQALELCTRLALMPASGLDPRMHDAHLGCLCICHAPLKSKPLLLLLS